jgi:hypothetical protein
MLLLVVIMMMKPAHRLLKKVARVERETQDFKLQAEMKIVSDIEDTEELHGYADKAGRTSVGYKARLEMMTSEKTRQDMLSLQSPMHSGLSVRIRFWRMRLMLWVHL